MKSFYQDALEAAVTSINNELEMTSSDLGHALCHWFAEARVKTRLYFMGAETARVSLWAQLRDDEPLLNMVLNASIHFSHQLGDEGMETLAKRLAGSVGGLTAKDNKQDATTDGVFQEMMPSYDRALRLFKTEHWLCFVTLVLLNLGLILPQITELTTKPGGKHATNTDRS